MKLPFLSVSTRTDGMPVPVRCPGASDCALGFTTLQSAGAFLQAMQLPEYELELVFRQSLSQYLTRLEEAGFRGIGFDVTPDRSEVKTLSIAELGTLLQQ